MKNIKRMGDCTSQRDLTPTGNSQSEPTLGCMISISLQGRGVCVWWWGGGGGVCVWGWGVGVVVCLNMTAWTDVYPM